MKYLCFLFLLFASYSSIAQQITVDLPLDPVFELQQENTIEAYPDVNSGTFELRLRDDTPERHTIMLVDLKGKSVATFKSSSEIIPVKVRRKLKGTYYLKVKNHKHIVPIKVTIT